MTKTTYEIGVVDESSVDANGNVMLFIHGEGVKGKYRIDEIIILKQGATTFRVDVGNLRFPKGIDCGLFLHGKILDENSLPKDLSGFRVYV